MKTLSRIILGVALAAPLAITSTVRADDPPPPAQTSPDSASPDSASHGDHTQEVTINQLPRAVKATVQRETKGKKIASITKSTDSSGAAAYDVKILDGAKETTIAVANNGKVTARKTGAAAEPSSSPGANPTDANPPRTNSPQATSPSAPPPASPRSAPPPSNSSPSNESPPLTNSPSETSPSSPPRDMDTPSTDKKQDQRPNPPGR